MAWWEIILAVLGSLIGIPIGIVFLFLLTGLFLSILRIVLMVVSYFVDWLYYGYANVYNNFAKEQIEVERPTMK